MLGHAKAMKSIPDSQGTKYIIQVPSGELNCMTTRAFYNYACTNSNVKSHEYRFRYTKITWRLNCRINDPYNNKRMQTFHICM